MRKSSILRGIALCFCLLLALGRAANADKVDDLIKKLKDPDNKVRLSAALALGKLNDQRAVGPLTDSLSDSDKTVRAVAAASLGKLLNSSTPEKERNRAIAELERVAKNDSDSFVRSQAQKAYDAVKGLASSGQSGGGIPAGKKFYVALGKFDSPKDPNYATLVTKTVQSSIDGDPRFFTKWPGTKAPTESDLKGAGLGGFYLQGSLSEISVNGGVVLCRASMAIATFPDQSIRANVKPEKAKAEVDTGLTNPSSRDLEEAKAFCVENLFQSVVKKNVLPFIVSYRP